MSADELKYVQEVADHCDRIVWRKNYYHLPLKDAAAKLAEAKDDEREHIILWLHAQGESALAAELNAGMGRQITDAQIVSAMDVGKAKRNAKFVTENAAAKIAALQQQLAQAREQLEYSNALEAQHDIIVADLNAQIEQMRERLTGASNFLVEAIAVLDGEPFDVSLRQDIRSLLATIKPPKAEPEL